MSLFKGLLRIWNEVGDDQNMVKEAAGREAVFNIACRFQDFGFYDLKSIPFYRPTFWSTLPADFKVCQDCFKAAIAPTPLARSFTRENKSSKNPEALVECIFSRPLNEPAWRASVEQGNEAPLVGWLEEVAIRKANVLKCPKDEESISKIPRDERVGFRTLRKNTTVKMCEYHFLDIVLGTWMEVEFITLPDAPPSTLCDFGSSKGLASIALCLAKRALNMKIFEDWAKAYRSLPACNTIIEAGHKKYTLPAVQYTSAERFQVCETCYSIIFKPHTTVQPHFKEIPGSQNPKRGICTMNKPSAGGYLEAVLKATWKKDPLALLEFAQEQVQVPACPGSSSATRTIWYKSHQIPGFVFCESCFQNIILPSSLHSSFGPVMESEEHWCDMSYPQVNAVFLTACKTGRIADFRIGLDELVAKQQANKAAERKAEQGALYPEQDLSKVRGTPQQIEQVEALRDEILMLQARADRLMKMGSLECSIGLEQMGYGNGMASIGGSETSYRFFDGHGTWFENRTQAEASAKQIEGSFKLQEASKLQIQVRQKRIMLRGMKEKLTLEP